MLNDQKVWRQINELQDGIAISVEIIKQRIWTAVTESLYDLDEKVTKINNLIDLVKPEGDDDDNG